MHHVTLEQWSRGASALHRFDARAKIAALLAFLLAVATTHRHLLVSSVLYLVLLLGALALARLPAAGILLRAGAVLPFSAVFAAITWVAGDAPRAVSLLAKSFLSAMAVLLLVSCTPLPQLLRGLESLGVPRFLLMTVQFLYRYLFVISEEAQHMRIAAASRGGWKQTARRNRFAAAAGALAVLFARSYERAEAIHRAMLSRGFQGQFHLLSAPRFRPADTAFALLSIALIAAIRAGDSV